MTDSSAPGGAARRTVAPGFPASGPTRSPWLRILLWCLAITGALLAVLAIVSALVSGPSASGSAAIGWLVVAVFFGISLLVGHLAGRNASSGALGVFLVTYIVKVVGFGAILAFFALPGWMDPMWFLISAVATVVLWQGTEVVAFAKTRLQIFGDPTETGTGDRG